MPLQVEKDKFIAVAKRILKTELSTNANTLFTYKSNIITAYISFVQYCDSKYSTLDATQKNTIIEALNYINSKFESCLIKLNCVYNLSENLFELPDPTTIRIIGLETEVTPIVGDMSISNIDFLKLCGETIPTAYSGDPLALQSFLHSITLLKSIANTETLKPLVVSFIKTRLNGKALECLPSDENLTIEQIEAALKLKIKPENEKIIRGKMAALRADRNTLHSFTDQAEKLADSLQRALVFEGIPSNKATQMTIDETINMCKSSAHSDYVKSVLASTSFATPKEVVAKFIIETNNDKTDKQILSYRANTHQNKPNNNQFRTNNQFQERSFQNNRPNFNRMQNATGNFNNNQPRNFNRNNYQRNNNFQNYQNNGQRSNFTNNNQNHAIRVAQSGNLNAPQLHLGGEQQETISQDPHSSQEHHEYNPQMNLNPNFET